MNCCKLVNLLAVLSAGTLHAESAFAAEAPDWERKSCSRQINRKMSLPERFLMKTDFLYQELRLW